MKSFADNLKDIKSYGQNPDILRKPVFRGSAIFPVIKNDVCTSRILFMGYWKLKRGINEIGLLVTLRSEEGDILLRKNTMVNDIKAYRVELDDLLSECKLPVDVFTGSIEMEVFSSRDLVFPFPAFVLNYYGKDFSSTVHSVGRIYNDIEDMTDNSSASVPETGFDIYPGSNYDPFFSVTNGQYENNNVFIEYKITNVDGNSVQGRAEFGRFIPYQTKIFKINEFVDIGILGGAKGSISISHNFEGIFPRWVAGNMVKTGQVNMTHTYYDLTGQNSEKDYWATVDKKFHDISIAFPVFMSNELYSEIVFYPIYSDCEFDVDFIFYDKDGNTVYKEINAETVSTSTNKHYYINFNELLDGKVAEISGIKSVLASYKFKGKVPTRLTSGLNVGYKQAVNGIASNICFTADPGNKRLLKKKSSFKWAPIMNVGRSVITVQNRSILKEYDKSANIKITIVNEKSGSILERTETIPPNGTYTLDTDIDDELKIFLDDRTGWVAIESDAPYVNSWYFDFNESSGIIAGDHSF